MLVGYKEPSIIPGIDAAIWSKTNFVPTCHNHPEAVPFCAHASFQVLLPFFKCILEVFLCEGVQHCLLFFLDHLSCVKMAPFNSYLQLEKERKLRWVGDDSHVFCKKKIPGEKESVRWCVVVMQHPVLLWPKFGAKSSHIFLQSL
jgi:hypothetical protein